MNLFNCILTKVALAMIVFCVAAAIDVPNNPARYLLRSLCHSMYRYSSDHPGR